MFSWDWSSAEREFRRAIALNPKYPVAHAWYSAYLAAMGRPDEAIAEGKRAQELDPLSSSPMQPWRGPFYNARRYDEAIAQSRKDSRDRSALRPRPLLVGSGRTSRNPCMPRLSPRFTRPS